ncbi:hypothetical protein Tco_1184899 [Tanacetum coccineum]
MEDTMLDLLEICQQKELYCIHNNVDDLMESALNSKLLLINLNSQRQTRITSCLQNFKVIHKENIIPLNKTPQISPSIALAPVSSIMEPEDSLIMGNEELSTIPEKESDEFIKSSVEDLIPIPRESEDTSGSDSESDLPSSDDLSPIFEEKSMTFCDDESLSDEDIRIPLMPSLNLIESLLNRDTLIDSSPKFDYLLEEFSGELAHIDPIPPGIEKADFDLEEGNPSC